MNTNKICGMELALMVQKLKICEAVDEKVAFKEIREIIRTINALGNIKEGVAYRVDDVFVSTNQISSNVDRKIQRGGFEQLVSVKSQALRHTALELENIESLARKDNYIRVLKTIDDGEKSLVIMEPCICSLRDLLGLGKQPRDLDARVELLKFLPHDLQLWEGRSILPTAQLLDIIRDIIEEIRLRHSVGLGHLYLTPEHILIAKKTKAGGTRLNSSSLCAKMIDYYNCKSDCSYVDANSKTSKVAAGLYTDIDASEDEHWKSPEELNGGSATLSSDMFKLGLIFHFCLSKGRHPYDSSKKYEIAENIRLHTLAPAMKLSDHFEAEHLVLRLLKRNPKERGVIKNLDLHPMFWNSNKRLEFLCRVSDKIFSSKMDPDTTNVQSKFAKDAAEIFGGNSWGTTVSRDIIEAKTEIKYSEGRLEDLLRLIRNRVNHYMEDPETVKKLLKNPDGIFQYFTSRFPKLMMKVYDAVLENYGTGGDFEEFFN